MASSPACQGVCHSLKRVGGRWLPTEQVLHTVLFTLHTVHCTLHTAHCTLHTAHWTLPIAHCTLPCTSKSHRWFKSYGHFTEGVDFAYWRSCVGKGLRLQPAQQAFYI